MGDVIFVLKAAAHESFERSGNDLLTKVTITLSEALLGFSRILVTHLDGRGVKVTSPPGKIIKPDDSIVLRGEGMPVYKNSDTKGNMYVVMSVEMPDENWLKSVNQSVSLQPSCTLPMLTIFLLFHHAECRHYNPCCHQRRRTCHQRLRL